MPFFRKLTGQPEFCSAEHRRLFQEEFDRQALARLRAARPKAAVKPAAVPPPPPEPIPSFAPVTLQFGRTLAVEYLRAQLQESHA